MLHQLFRWAIRIACLLGITLFLYLNFRLYDNSFAAQDERRAELLAQLRYLKRAIHAEQAAEKAQTQYPEGYMFLHALYALAWCEAVTGLSPQSEDYQEGRTEVLRGLQSMDSPVAKSVFNSSLPLENGAFYRGWTAYVRGRFIQHFGMDTLQVRLFESDCMAIASAASRAEGPYLESYDGLAWPADNVVCLAALARYDRMYEPRFEAVREKWLADVRHTLLRDLQLIPHGYDLAQNQALEGGRGSSQALILSFLPEIDSGFSSAQYDRFRTTFVRHYLGLPCIREYPTGTSGGGDIDSGPVVFGIGGAASIVAIRAAAAHEDWTLATSLSASTGALLFPQKKGGEKFYLFGRLPMLDAFLAWSNAGFLVSKPPETRAWRWRFQMISAVFLCFLVWGFRKTLQTRP